MQSGLTQTNSAPGFPGWFIQHAPLFLLTRSSVTCCGTAPGRRRNPNNGEPVWIAKYIRSKIWT